MGRCRHGSWYNRYQVSAAEGQFKDIVTAIGCPDATIHSLRHTYATTAMQMGIDPKSIQESMGHYSSAFTIDQYGHAMKDVQKENASKLDSAFSQLKYP